MLSDESGNRDKLSRLHREDQFWPRNIGICPDGQYAPMFRLRNGESLRLMIRPVTQALEASGRYSRPMHRIVRLNRIFRRGRPTFVDEYFDKNDCAISVCIGHGSSVKRVFGVHLRLPNQPLLSHGQRQRTVFCK